MGDMGP